jgi:hypothetical protein
MPLWQVGFLAATPAFSPFNPDLRQLSHFLLANLRQLSQHVGKTEARNG